jgi:hypothetical protein
VLQKLFEFIRAKGANKRKEDAFLMGVVYCCLQFQIAREQYKTKNKISQTPNTELNAQQKYRIIITDSKLHFAFSSLDYMQTDVFYQSSYQSFLSNLI